MSNVAWTCPSCATVWHAQPLVDGVIGCPSCGSIAGGDQLTSRLALIRDRAVEDRVLSPGEAAEILARLSAAEQERERTICSNCGDEHEGDLDAGCSDCCNCDLMPATALPGLLKSTRAEVDENERLSLAAEAREEAARKLIEDAERYFGKRMLIEENAPFRVQLRDWLARAALAGREETT